MRIKHIGDLVDTRREPKSLRYCVICQRDIGARSERRVVHLFNNEYALIHPDDWDDDKATERKFYVGPECVKKIGIEWTKLETGSATATP